MPPHLHPRSWTTTSLFGTTLAISFLVVGMPHLVPCPAPRTALADVEITPDGRRIRRSRVAKNVSEKESVAGDTSITPTEQALLKAMRDGKGRECPVPKPSGALGRILGFDEKK